MIISFLSFMNKTIILILAIILVSHQAVFQKYYDEAYSIAIAMSLQQKLGQIVQVDFSAFTSKKGTDNTLAIKFHVGSLLANGDTLVDENGNVIFPDTKEDEDRKQYAKCTIEKWKKLTDKFNYQIKIITSEGYSYSIKPLLATDAVHGNQHVSGSILFPHNSGLACSHNPQNFYNAGYWTSESVKSSGFNYAFSPTVAVSHNPHWGRFYESLGQQQEYIYQFAKRYTEGLQGRVDKFSGVIGSAKHFYGDGSTLFGADQGNSIVSSFNSFVKHNTQGYNGSANAGIASVMVSYSSINWIPNSVSPSINTILRQKIGFDGFIITDYNEAESIISQQLPTKFSIMNESWDSVSTLANAGIDMFMIPGSNGISLMTRVINGYKQALKNQTISIERLNDAVARIISVKLAVGVAKKIKTSLNMNSQQGNIQKPEKLKTSTQYEDSLTAVHESLVLLKNNGALPVAYQQLQYIVLVGERVVNINGLGRNELFRNFDNIGMQNGGWTLRWQGFEGNSQWQGQNKKASKATSILDALQSLGSKAELIYPKYKSFTQQVQVDLQRSAYLRSLVTLRKKMTPNNTLIVAVIGETTFAQFKGDVAIPYCMNETILTGDGCLYDNAGHPYLPQRQRASLALDFQKFDKQVISNIRQENKNIPLVTILLTGRPMLIDNVLKESSAVLDAWLPGTSGGEGIINAITGKYKIRPNGLSDRRNTLAFDWPKNQESLKLFPIYGADGQVPRISDPLFQVGYGLSTALKIQQQLLQI